MIRSIIPCFFCLIFLAPLSGQVNPFSVTRLTVFKKPGEGIFIDSFPIAPGSLSVKIKNKGVSIDSSVYRVYNGYLFLDPGIKELGIMDTLQIKYVSLPFTFNKVWKHLDTTLLDLQLQDGESAAYYQVGKNEQSIFDINGLDYTGSFSKGLVLGNKQDLVLNSGFNMQINGILGDDLEVAAALSDNNIPLQPDGNTRQLNEFDKIFISVKRKKMALLAGDYDLANPPGHFVRYFKKSLGVQLNNESLLKNKAKLTQSAGYSISRGKFNRITLQQIEGNQGPYKLTGESGERFIIVLSGTERVYIDDQQLTRGLEYDYVIDYNRGEISFTPRRVITKDSRIIVEYQYAEQNYLRTLFNAGVTYEKDKLKMSLQMVSEQDSKNSLGTDIDSAAIAVLKELGNRTDSAFVSGIRQRTEPFNAGYIYYLVKDTVVNGNIYPGILAYTTDSLQAKYTARFSDVGEGNGNYNRMDGSTNGAVYQWVAPDISTGRPTGRYEPIVHVTPPALQQMYTVGTRYDWNKNGGIETEVSMSKKDVNRFSSKDADNIGLASFVRVYQTFYPGKKADWSIITDMTYEGVQSRFKEMNPYRNQEFVRDWSVDRSISADENLGSIGLKIDKKQLFSGSYRIGFFTRDNLYKGIRHIADMRLGYKKSEIKISGSLVNADDNVLRSSFFRPKMEIGQFLDKKNRLKAGVYYESEKNTQKKIANDSLSLTSFYYNTLKLYLENRVSEKLKFGISYKRRWDYAPVAGTFLTSAVAGDLSLDGTWAQTKSNKLEWVFTYRKLDITPGLIKTTEPKSTYIGKVSYNLNVWKNALSSNTYYEIGSGQEPRIEFIYQKTLQKGQGQYVWNDLNGDGVQQVNEFEIAPFADQADYIRVAVVTQDLIATNNVIFNQSLRFDPRSLFAQKNKFNEFMGRFSTQSSLRINRKNRETSEIDAWNPFQLNISDSSLVTLGSSIANTLYFNRISPVYDVQLGMTDSRTRVFLTSGSESRKQKEQFLRSRYNINNAFSNILTITKGEKENETENFEAKNYRIQFLKMEPNITWQIKSFLRLSLGYNYQISHNVYEGGGETAVFNNSSLEFTYNKTNASAVRLSFTLADIRFDGLANSATEFAMLDGLKNGKNYLWSLSIDRKMANNIILSLGYDGRKTGTASVVHLGRASVRASF